MSQITRDNLSLPPITPQTTTAYVKPAEPKLHKAPHRWPMILIGVGKISKALGLLALGVGIHYFLAEPYRSQLAEYVAWAGQDPHNHFLYQGIEKLLGVSLASLKAIRIGFFIYAGLYGIEGIGVLAERKWAEWMVVITTAGFIPLEIFEILRDITWWKVALLGLNVLAMGYLIFRLKRMATIKKETHAAGFPVVQPAAAAPPKAAPVAQ